MGRNKKNKPKRIKKFPYSLSQTYQTPKYFMEKLVVSKPNRIEVPYGKGGIHGSEAERKVMSILETSRIPNELILKPAFVRTENGESEISDGIILYGNTAFLLQIKSRNKPSSEMQYFEKEIDKVEDLVSTAYKQAKVSLKYLKEHQDVLFEDMNNNPVKINYSDYNWISLILINHASFEELNFVKSLIIDNDVKIRGVPRVVLSFQDLENISASFERIPYYVLNYLRRLQYQPNHTLGNDNRYKHFLNYRLYNSNVDDFFIEYEKVIMDLFSTKKEFIKSMADRLIYSLDNMDLSEMSRIQKLYMDKKIYSGEYFDKARNGLKDFFICSDSDIAKTEVSYATLFYNSEKFPAYTSLAQELDFITKDYMMRHIESLDTVLAIAVDVSKKNPQRTVGTFLTINAERYQ